MALNANFDGGTVIQMVLLAIALFLCWLLWRRWFHTRHSNEEAGELRVLQL